jgi:uncharacterized damage-inducible protein DinB
MRRVPSTGGEKENLQVSLDRHRGVVLWKLEGLDDEQLRQPMVPSGTSVLGLVKHLASVEYGWFCETFGRDTEHMVEETARHAGHMDIVRELIDGSIGDHRPYGQSADR